MSRKARSTAQRTPPPPASPTRPERAYRNACDLWLAFADGEFHLMLGIPQIRELERLAGIGIGAIFGRVMQGRFFESGNSFGFAAASAFKADDVNHIVRLALIGGGEAYVDGELVKIDPQRAQQLVEAYCPPAQPFEYAWAIAAAVLDALMNGREPTPPHPAEAVEAEIMRQAAERPPSPAERAAMRATAGTT